MRVLSFFVIALITITALLFSLSATVNAEKQQQQQQKRFSKIDGGVSAADYPWPPSCYGPGSGRGSINCATGPDNNTPVWPLPPDYTAPPTFVRSVKNGILQQVGTVEDNINIIHLYSDAPDDESELYEMGLAFGQLMPKEINSVFQTLIPWVENELLNALPSLPTWLADMIVADGLPHVLDLVYDLTEKNIPPQYIQQWKGMAAGAKCDLKTITRVVMIPQLTKAACTALSSIQPASKECIQLRDLDFAPSSHVADYSSIIVYHYKNKPVLMNFGYLSLTGCLTCMSYDFETGNVIFGGEKDWGGPQTTLPVGTPWLELFRETLELPDLDAIGKLLVSKTSGDPNPRDGDTVAIHLVYTQTNVINPTPETNQQVGWEIGYNYSKKFDWYTHKNSSSLHQDRPGLLWFSKNDDTFPHTPCTNDLIQSKYGNITADWLSHAYSAGDRSGDTQSVAVQISSAAMTAYVANSRKSTVTSGSLCGYYRQRNVIDLKALLNQKQN